MKLRWGLPTIISLLALAACGCAATLRATTLLRLDVDELARAADAVALVRCIESAGYTEQGNVWTRTEFTVLETWKGSPPPRLTVRLPGGRLGHIVVTIEAVPRFRAGEEGVLFLQELPTGDYSVSGWALGSFRMRRNERTGEQTLTQDSSALAVFDPASRRFVTEGIRDLPLGEFRRRVAATLRGQASAKGKP